MSKGGGGEIDEGRERERERARGRERESEREPPPPPRAIEEDAQANARGVITRFARSRKRHSNSRKRSRTLSGTTQGSRQGGGSAGGRHGAATGDDERAGDKIRRSSRRPYQPLARPPPKMELTRSRAQTLQETHGMRPKKRRGGGKDQKNAGRRQRDRGWRKSSRRRGRRVQSNSFFFHRTCKTTSGLIGAVKTAGRAVWPEAVPSRPCTVTRGREAAILKARKCFLISKGAIKKGE